MSMHRASANMLRSRLRTTAVTAPLRRSQIRAIGAKPRPGHIKDDGDLGGPGGQQPPPQAPGGPEALKRNWLPIGGTALLVIASFWYLTSEPVAKAPPRTREGDLRAASSTEIGHMPPPSGRSIAKALEDKESAALGELSGRKGKDGMGGFRAE